MTRTEAAVALFKAYPGVWLDAERFVQPCGRCGFTARIRDCRKAPYHMHIENRVLQWEGYKLSQYRYVPPGQQELIYGPA